MKTGEVFADDISYHQVIDSGPNIGTEYTRNWPNVLPTVSFGFTDTVSPYAEGFLTVNATGDFNSNMPDEYLDVYCEDNGYLGRLFAGVNPPSYEVLTINQSVLHTLAEDGQIELSFRPGAGVKIVSYESVSLSYGGHYIRPDIQPVPEPTTLSLLALSAVGLGVVRRRRAAARGRRYPAH